MCERILRWLMPWRQRQLPGNDFASTFQARYARFKELLDSNSELSRIIGDIEEKLQGHQLFGRTYIRSQASRASFHTKRMIDSLNAVSGNKYPQLYEVFAKIDRRLKEEVGEREEITATGWIIPLSGVTRDMVDQVGGKNANLGEVMNRTGLPVPDGFAITTRACDLFLGIHQLVEALEEHMDMDRDDPESVNHASGEIQRLIIEAEVPPELSEALLAAYDDLVDRIRQRSPDYGGEVSVRSSAVGEDAELSHAGQYLTVLNVRRDGIVHAYKRVVASLFSPWALSYRFQKGVRDEDLTMGVACLQMIDPVTSGVAFSRHPFRGFEDVAIINAVWGLGLFAVSGKVTPDLYTVARDESLAIVQSRISSKPLKLITSPEGGIKETEVPEEQQDVRCLSPEQVRHLAQCAIDLETHYGSPQDVEWAIDREDRVWILQSRPLRITATPGKEVTGDNAQLGDFPLLLEGGAVAFPGIGSGPIFHVEGEEDLKSFPEGAVLVARHPSPRFVTAMRTAQAIITDTGSPLGHMASLSREFQVPTLLGTRVATSSLKEGMVVTVDAHSGRVYEGRVEALIDRQAAVIPYMKDTPASAALARVADLIVPLRLINPRSPSFSAAACRSLHDIMRFVHESSYAAMFKLSDLLSNSEGGAVKLKAPIPLDLYVIDLGGGMAEDRRSQRSVTAAEVKSVPFQALLQGMMRPEVQIHHRSRPIEVRGLLSVMSEQMLTPPGSGGERFGDRSYAIISDRYLHFSSRIGYHYSILDSYCDEQTRKSYITFSFQGGAADETRRGRRARAITLVLKAHGFTVDNKADRVDSRLRRAEMSVLLEKLDMIGRLLQFTRQLDMLMFNEKSVQAAATAFLEGRYQLDGMA